MINIYTDGSCLKNGKGGWAAIVMEDTTVVKALWGREEGTTNNRQELKACIAALKYIREHTVATDIVTIIADSQYVLGGCQQWLPKWELKSFYKVKNVDLWKEIAGLLKGIYSRINFVWVHGHTKEQSDHHKGNDLADKLCTQVHNL